MDFVSSVGMSGGILCIWDPRMFEVLSVVKNRYFLLLAGKLKGSGIALNVDNVYAPQSVSAKQVVWNELLVAMEDFTGLWVVGGDFNAVRDPSERRNSRFNNSCAMNFNNFILDSGLLEYDLKGRKFTCIRGNGKKLSKIDRFLVCSEFFNRWPNATFRALPANYSDHGPILLVTQLRNFGAKPFRVFNSWLEKEGYKEAVEKSLEGFDFVGPSDSSLIQKMATIRKGIKSWRIEMKKKEGEAVNRALEEMEEMESLLESRDLSKEEEWTFLENKKLLMEIERSSGGSRNFFQWVQFFRYLNMIGPDVKNSGMSKGSGRVKLIT
ncbi:uncharacterized protein LOC118491546 [Helianthus annuus]|uniref:uncharacterized protein LOC118491546 n=1 Tax=Helianthus annuus TaxID=4232 RepID=UPI001652D753|nr:uncharacterized protein LOC118491546 [Helianthus annuus]